MVRRGDERERRNERQHAGVFKHATDIWSKRSLYSIAETFKNRHRNTWSIHAGLVIDTGMNYLTTLCTVCAMHTSLSVGLVVVGVRMTCLSIIFPVITSCCLRHQSAPVGNVPHTPQRPMLDLETCRGDEKHTTPAFGIHLTSEWVRL